MDTHPQHIRNKNLHKKNNSLAEKDAFLLFEVARAITLQIVPPCGTGAREIS